MCNRLSIILFALSLLTILSLKFMVDLQSQETDKNCQEIAIEICEQYCGPIK